MSILAGAQGIPCAKSIASPTAFSFNTSIAAIAEPPVASIGSTIIISLSSISCGNLQ